MRVRASHLTDKPSPWKAIFLDLHLWHHCESAGNIHSTLEHFYFPVWKKCVHALNVFMSTFACVCVLGFVCVRPQADGQGDAELKQDWKRGPVSFPSKPPSSVFTMQPDVSLRTHSAPWLQSSEWTTQFTALFIFSIQHAQSAAHFWIDTFSQCWCVHPCCTITAVFQTFASA